MKKPFFILAASCALHVAGACAAAEVAPTDGSDPATTRLREHSVSPAKSKPRSAGPTAALADKPGHGVAERTHEAGRQPKREASSGESGGLRQRVEPPETTVPRSSQPGRKTGNVAGGCISFEPSRSVKSTDRKTGNVAGTCIAAEPGRSIKTTERKSGNVAGNCITFELGRSIKSTERKTGNVAGSCIPMVNPAQGSNALYDMVGPPKPESKPGQKRGTSRSDCEPGTLPSGDATRTQRDGERMVHVFPSGAKLYAELRDGAVRRYTAFDSKGVPLKVTLQRRASSGLRPGPGEAIERGKQRAGEERERFMAGMREAIESGEVVSKGCVIIVLSPEGRDLYYGDCPKGLRG